MFRRSVHLRRALVQAWAGLGQARVPGLVKQAPVLLEATVISDHHRPEEEAMAPPAEVGPLNRVRTRTGKGPTKQTRT